MKIKSYFVQLPYNTEEYEVGKSPSGHNVPKGVTVTNISYRYNPISCVADGVSIELSNGDRVEFNDSVPCRIVLTKEGLSNERL